MSRVWMETFVRCPQGHRNAEGGRSGTGTVYECLTCGAVWSVHPVGGKRIVRTLKAGRAA